jgi:hypothetical protein
MLIIINICLIVLFIFPEIGGKGYITLTDNKSFLFYYHCYDDNEATWGVTSTTKTLDEATVKKIHDEAISLGFSEKYFTQIHYDACTENSGASIDTSAQRVALYGALTLIIYYIY